MDSSKTAEILCVGTELLLGDIVNTNASYIARRLSETGISVYRQGVVGDNAARLKTALAESFSRADIVILTGGLGPTCDDLTKEVVADFFETPLVLHEETKEKIKNYFEHTHRKMPCNNLKQAMIPDGSVILQNNCGTAPGIFIEKNGKIAILLPGPPYEMKPMFEEEAIPHLVRISGKIIYSLNLHLYGIGESAAEEELKSYMDSENPTVAPYAGEGEVRLRITAAGASKEECVVMCRNMAEKIRNTPVGQFIYAETDNPYDEAVVLEKAVFDLLRRKKLTIVAAESCTGGMLSERLTAIPGVSEVFLGGVVSYANGVKERALNVKDETLDRFGAVSEPVAAEMAEGVRSLTGADVAVSITGIAGPDGGSEEKPVGTVCFAIKTKEGITTKTVRFSKAYDRQQIRRRSTATAFHMIIDEIRQL